MLIAAYAMGGESKILFFVWTDGLGMIMLVVLNIRKIKGEKLALWLFGEGIGGKAYGGYRGAYWLDMEFSNRQKGTVMPSRCAMKAGKSSRKK
jgi:hypothetical protein